MKLDLYKIYKLMSQRARRHPRDIRRAEVKQLSKQLITDVLNKAEMLEVVDRVEELENSLPSISRFYAPDLRKAIVEDSYTCEMYVVRTFWTDYDLI